MEIKPSMVFDIKFGNGIIVQKNVKIDLGNIKSSTIECPVRLGGTINCCRRNWCIYNPISKWFIKMYR